MERFIELARTFHPTITFTAHISENEITFLDTGSGVQRREIHKKSILDIKTHYKPTKTFQYTHFTLCHPSWVKRGFIKGESIRLLEHTLQKQHLKSALLTLNNTSKHTGIQKKYIESSLSEVAFDSRQSALKRQKHKTAERLLSFVTTYHPVVKKLKQIAMENWSGIEILPLLKTIFKTLPCRPVFAFPLEELFETIELFEIRQILPYFLLACC